MKAGRTTEVRPTVATHNVPSPDQPMAVARRLLADRMHHGLHTLHSWRGGWMSWEGSHWADSEEAAVRSRVYRQLENAEYMTASGKPAPWNPNRRKIADVMQALAAVTHLPETVSPPAWIGGAGPYPPGQVVACANGLLHVGSRTLIDHTPAFFGLVSVPLDYAPEAQEPQGWLKFLGELWPDDKAAVASLQEFFGYVLSGRTDLHKIMLMVGPARSGKGTIARVLASLIGDANVAGPTLASLGTNFGLSPLLGRPLAVVSDARLGGADTRQVVERLLSVSGEDRLTVDRKYREPWTGTLPTRFLVLSNELPMFGDASGAIANRFVILTLVNSWLGHENPALTGELLAERAGILAWALDGLDRLTSQGYLSEPASSSEAALALADLVSPVAAFVRDECRRGPELSVTVSALWAAWRVWCEVNCQPPRTKQWFGRDLRAVIPALTMKSPVDETGRQVRTYVGLKLSAS